MLNKISKLLTNRFTSKILNKFTNRLSNRFSSVNLLNHIESNNNYIVPTSPNSMQTNIIDNTIPFNTGKKRLVILGSGWAGARLAQDIDCIDKYDLTIISSKNHMVFTPLLASSCVGTVHSQSVIENIRHLQPGLKFPQNHFYLAYAENIDTVNNVVECVNNKNSKFKVGYDKLIIATGGKPQTFNIPGVEENAHFLKSVDDSVKIRKKLLENVCLAGIPNIKTNEKNKLLHIVIVGGGPTGVEIASEITNFINEDMYNYNPDIRANSKITLIEGNEILNSFDVSLRSHAICKLIDNGVIIKKAQVKYIDKDYIKLDDESKLNYGICIWSTGIGPTKFTKSLDFKKSKNGQLLVDDSLRVYDKNSNIINNVYALGDTSVIENNPLPSLAQVAEQQGKFLAYYLNNTYDSNIIDENNIFKYNHFGSMVCLTTANGLLEIGDSKKYKFTGLTSWLAWRSAYLTKLQTSKNKINIASQWLGTITNGREIGF